MIGNTDRLISIVVTGIIVGALFLFTVFFAGQNFSFLLGFTACFICVALLLILAQVWQPREQAAERASRFKFFASVFLILAALLSIALLFRQNVLFKAMIFHDRMEMNRQSELIESMRISNMVVLMSNVLDKVDEELKNNPERSLSTETIARIAALSLAFRPYKMYEGDTLSEQKYSPERGQLLQALAKMNLDSSSFDRIKLSTTFAGAYLSGANLHAADLSGADLQGANLRDANVSGANLRKVNLTDANLWGADLHAADLREAMLKRANLQWIDLNDANLVRANLGGADLSSAVLNRAQLDSADLRVAIFRWASLSAAELSSAYLHGADLRNANLSNADLSQTVLRDTKLTEANLHDAELTDAEVDEANWPDMLEQWHVMGATAIHERYGTTNDKTGLFYVLVKKD